MRTSICEGIGAFIVVEGWHLFLGAEVFSLWDSTWIVPNVINKIFPCREDLYLGIPWWLSVYRKYFPFRVFAVSIHNRPLHKLGLPFIDPQTWIHQAHLIGPIMLYFYPLQYHFKKDQGIHLWISSTTFTFHLTKKQVGKIFPMHVMQVYD